MAIAFILLRLKELLYFGISFCSFHCEEMLSWQSSANTRRNSGFATASFPAWKSEGVFVTGHLTCLELPGAAWHPRDHFLVFSNANLHLSFH